MELLNTLKLEKLNTENGREKVSSRDAVKQRIYDYLYDDKTGLPVDSYEAEEIEALTGVLFTPIYRAFPALPSSIYCDWIQQN